MRTSQSFPFYPTDFMMGTMFMTPSQVGGYIRALCYQWESGGFPVLPEEQKRVTGCDENDLKIILGKFSEKRGVLVNKKMEQVRKERLEYVKVQRENGKLGGRPRKNPSVSIGLSETKPKKSLPSPSPSPSPLPNNTPLPPRGNGGDSRHHEITSRIKAEYRAATGQEMAFNGGQDGKALLQFLTGWSGTTDDFFRIARKAWRRSLEPYASATKQAHTLSGLCRHFGPIVAESEQQPAATNGTTDKSHPTAANCLNPR